MLGSKNIVAFVPTKDPAKARQFYEGVLGLRNIAYAATIRERLGVGRRVVVVGDRCVAAAELVCIHGDFRAIAHGGSGSFTTEPPSAIAAAAVAAVKATRLEFGGVDILDTADGPYVLESNFPCFFPEAELLAGIDVSGAMVDHLIRKAIALESTT